MPAPLIDASGYSGRRIALLTRHGKERVIAPVLEPAIGCRVELVEGFDTDQLGTFTREIPRAGAQLEAARRKARIGMQLGELCCGLASEGSFGPDPMLGMFPWNVELLVLIDDRQGLEVVGVAQGRANSAQLLAADWAAAEAFARQVGFPEQQLIVRPDSEHDLRLRKDIADWPNLETAFAWALVHAASGKVFLETDLRAHANPTRQGMIRAAAEDLAAKLQSPCPACGAPGFWIIERVPGLPCAACTAPTREARADILACVRCGHRLTRPRSDHCEADPARCDYCNP